LWRIDENLYQGNLLGAQNDELLRQFGIQVVISILTRRQAALRQLVDWHPGASSVESHMVFDLHDNANPAQINGWENCLDAITETVRTGRRTLVHCTQGVSRSGIAAVLVYARLHDLKPDEAIARINGKYRVVGGWNPKLFSFLCEELSL